jgi:CPA2 family monovalent cation:H+ antiporter-2
VGRELADALERRKFRYLVIEYNPVIVRELRERGVPVIYGDAGNPAVLEHAHLETARLMAVVIPDAHATEVATRQARVLQPDLDIVARAADADHVQRLRRAGASDVVQPEFEAGVEVIRHAMRRYGIDGLELGHLATGRRATFYAHAIDETAR